MIGYNSSDTNGKSNNSPRVRNKSRSNSQRNTPSPRPASNPSIFNNNNRRNK